MGARAGSSSSGKATGAFSHRHATAKSARRDRDPPCPTRGCTDFQQRAAQGQRVTRAHVGHEQLHAAAAAEFVDLRREGHVHPLADAHAQLRRGAREEDAGIIIPALGKMQPQVRPPPMGTALTSRAPVMHSRGLGLPLPHGSSASSDSMHGMVSRCGSFTRRSHVSSGRCRPGSGGNTRRARGGSGRCSRAGSSARLPARGRRSPRDTPNRRSGHCTG